jgi:hypothetical protein
MTVPVNPKNGVNRPVNTYTNSGRERFMGSDRNVGLPGIRSPRRRLSQEDLVSSQRRVVTVGR